MLVLERKREQVVRGTRSYNEQLRTFSSIWTEFYTEIQPASSSVGNSQPQGGLEIKEARRLHKTITVQPEFEPSSSYSLAGCDIAIPHLDR